MVGCLEPLTEVQVEGSWSMTPPLKGRSRISFNFQMLLTADDAVDARCKRAIMGGEEQGS